ARSPLARGPPTGAHAAAPPAAVDAVEPERADRGEDTAHRFRRQRDVVRVASHEAHEAHVGNDSDRVADEERAATLRARGPVEDRAPLEVTAALHERDAWEDLARALPER